MQTAAKPLAPRECSALARWVRRSGEREVLQALRLSRITLYRAMAGLALYPSTGEVIRSRLAAQGK